MAHLPYFLLLPDPNTGSKLLSGSAKIITKMKDNWDNTILSDVCILPIWVSGSESVWFTLADTDLLKYAQIGPDTF